MRNSYAIIEEDMQTKNWAIGDAFSMADCSASPALFYANKVEPFGDKYPAVNDTMTAGQRAAFARVIEERSPTSSSSPTTTAIAMLQILPRSI